MISTCKQIVKNEGLRALWNGTTPTIIRNVPGSAMYFYTLGFTRNALTKHVTSEAWLVNIISGSFSRLSIGLILMPISVVKSRYESR